MVCMFRKKWELCNLMLHQGNYFVCPETLKFFFTRATQFAHNQNIVKNNKNVTVWVKFWLRCLWQNSLTVIGLVVGSPQYLCGFPLSPAVDGASAAGSGRLSPLSGVYNWSQSRRRVSAALPVRPLTHLHHIKPHPADALRPTVCVSVEHGDILKVNNPSEQSLLVYQ